MVITNTTKIEKLASFMTFAFDTVKNKFYSDEDLEPTVLPANFPNLLVNGSTGISAGYATNIPPHNMNEVIDGVLMLS